MRNLAATLSGLALFVSQPAFARELPNFDAQQEAAVTAPPAFRRVASGPEGLVAHRDDRTGAPTFIWAQKSGAQVQSRARFAAMTPEAAALAQVQAQAPLFGLADFGAAGVEVSSVSRDRLGLTVVQLAQRSDGIEVFRQSLSVLLDRNQEVVAVSGSVSKHVGAEGSTRLPFRLTAPQAISFAYRDLTGAELDAGMLAGAGTRGTYAHFQLASFARAPEQELLIPARAKQVLYPLSSGLVAAYYVELNTGEAGSRSSDYYAYVISAADGRLLMRNNLTAHADFSYRVFADTYPPYTPFDGPSGNNASPHPTGQPAGYQPSFVAPNLVTLRSVPFSRGDEWLPDGATVTTGNNVDAYADLVAPDGYNDGDLRPTVTAPGVFDRTLLFDLSPQANAEQVAAATTSLFFLNNWLHDWFYDSGFDEASGNAQASNFGRGGLENDSLRAQAQDFGGTNNSNMTTPADGASPRMQMYLFSGARNAQVQVIAPGSLAGSYPAGVATGFGPQTFDVTREVVFGLDAADAAGPTTTDACSALTNDVVDKIVFVDRGTCTFNVKVANAQTAGAAGVLVADNLPGGLSDLGGSQAGLTIPALRITQSQGNSLRAAIPGLTVRLFRGIAIPLDGAVDNALVAHEWGHLISSRLVHDANGLVNQQGRAMGEGWGDFTALLMTVRPEDINVPANANWTGVYAFAEHATRGISSDAAYFGYRRTPYSVDASRNALRFRHITDGVATPTTTPFVPKGANSEVHNAGEIWASMLWEAYVSLLRAHPFQEAQDRMKSYLVNGYKLTPVAPTFVEARDAILAAALANDPADFKRMWGAFAQRGMGVGAVAPDRWSVTLAGVVESYQVGAAVQLVSVAYADASGSPGDADGILDNDETGELRIVVYNSGSEPAYAASATVVSSTSGVTIGNRGTVNFPVIEPQQSVQVAIPVTLHGAGLAQRLDFSVSVRDDAQAIPGDVSGTLSFKANYDEVPAVTATETVEASSLPWFTDHDSALLAGGFDVVEFEDLNRAFFAPDYGSASDVRLITPPLAVSSTVPLTLTFRHAHDFEADGSAAYDGAVIELTDDGGATWVDVGTPLYTRQLITYDGNLNPLGGRMALAGTSAGFPALQQARLELGTAWAGKTVQLRFRVGSDNASGNTGWLLDDLAFGGLTNAPFTAICADSGVCANRAPVPYAGADTAVDERSPVTLSGFAWDADGQALSYVWARVSGPAVTLTGANTLTPNFIAPEVSQNTNLVLRLTVSDGIAAVSDTVTLTVRQVNRPPAVNAGLDATVNERAVATLSGSAADPDGNPLRYQWTQVAGPLVGLVDAASATATFTAPETALEETLTFRLTVDDGQTSVSDTVSLLVQNVNRAPSLTASSVTVEERASVTLTASAVDPDGDPLSYSWEHLADPPLALTGADTSSASFAAGEVAADAVLTFRVTVSDGSLSVSTEVQVDVRNVNRAPTVSAGVNAVVAEREVAVLEGYALDEDGDALTYQWVQTAGTPVALSGAATATATLVAPETAIGEVLTFRLTVSDGSLIASDSVAVVVNAANRAPSVSAADVEVDERSTATLFAAGSDPDGDALSYLWEQLSGTGVTLAGADTASASFATGEVSSGATLTFRVTVSDGVAAASREVTVTLRDVNRPPQANAGAAVTAKGKTAVQLNGSESFDPEGSALGYAWTQLGGPWVALTGADSATPSFTAPDVRQDTLLVFGLVVSDGALSSAASTVQVTVTASDNQAPVAVAVLHVAGASSSITLDGSGSHDPDGDALTYRWRQISGPEIELTSATAAVTTVEVPEGIDQAGESFVFELTVTDSRGGTNATTTDTTVTPVGGCSSTGMGGSAGLLAVAMLGMLGRRRRSAR